MSNEIEKKVTPSTERLGSERCGHRLFPHLPDCTLPRHHANKWHRHQRQVEIQDIVDLEASLQSGGLLKPNTGREAR